MPLHWPEPGFAGPADLAACRALLRGGSRSFFAASLLLPQRVRGPACSLYAFCRLADDAIDLEDGRMDALARLHARLDRAYAGQPLPTPVDRAFADVIARYAIPRALPEALFEGFAWDAEGRRYEDLPALQAYAVRVAGTVGAMMAVLMGVREPGPVARACDLGVAMQLSNIAARMPAPAASICRSPGCAKPASTPTSGSPARPSATRSVV
jgi:phytoene synthase